MPLPNFLIIGAAKSGTTSLYRYIGQHPDVYVSPIKELRFFVLNGSGAQLYRGPTDDSRYPVTCLGDYLSYFEGAAAETAIGEATPDYLVVPEVPKRIRQRIPHARLIAILRDPTERAYSHYLYLRLCGEEMLESFADALATEDERFARNWSPGWWYRRGGLYFEQLSRYHAQFDPSQIRVYLYEDFCERPVDLIKDVFGFLGVDDTFEPDMSIRYQQGGLPRSATIHAIIRKPGPIKSVYRLLVPARHRERLTKAIKSKNLVKPGLDPEIRRQLIDFYREDILRLQDLIGRDLSAWLAVEPS